MRHKTSCLSAALLMAVTGAPMAGADPTLMKNVCGLCHTQTDKGFSRIEGQRKTPEGWMMSIVRMQQSHGLDISAEDRRKIVQHLSDTQGLAPSETAKFRYGLEKDPNVVETPDEPMASMCARCHTEARVGLQRRSAQEWSVHMDFHVGNYPTIEYQALGRDREWFKIAKEEIAPLLAQTYPLETDAWTAWQEADKKPVAGDWVVMTDLPHAGEAYGRLSVTGDASPYQVSGKLMTADGKALPVTGTMNLYTGFEWRATLDIDGQSYRQVLALSENGNTLEGRQFLRARDSLGGRLVGVRADQDNAILGTVPSAVPAGSASVQVVGAGLDDLNAGSATVKGNAFGASIAMTTNGNGMVNFTAGSTQGSVAHYASVDSLVVEPAFTIARVGGDSDVGPAAVPAHFNAIGMWNGPDGLPGTDDDIRIGRVKAKWSVTNKDEAAAAMRDAHFAGQIDQMGIFTPSPAGPNPERKYSTNNAGLLTVQAEALGHSADGSLIVTVQRFIDPPLR